MFSGEEREGMVYVAITEGLAVNVSGLQQGVWRER